jgi:hypothetical protein
MDDVGNHFHSLFTRPVPSLALLTEIRNLAHFILFAHFPCQSHCHQTRGLPHLCHLWIQCLDPAQSLKRTGIFRQLQALYFV